jgi:hypothetical protein
MDDEDKAILGYKPPLSHMKNALWVLWFAFLSVMILWNQTETPMDPWFGWGGWFTAIGIALFVITPLVISRDSPKIVSNTMGSTIASPQPLKIIPAQAAHPAYGVYAAGSVKAWFFFDFVASTRAYVIAPLDLVYVVGEEGNERGKGLNLVVNSPLEKYYDHSTLPPHILESLKTMKKPGYDKNMPILYNWWPLMVNELTEKDKEKLQQDLRRIGVDESQMQNAVRIYETYSCKLSKFRYEDQLTNMEENLDRREKIVNSENSDLREMVEYLKKENKDLYERIVGPREQERPRGLFDIPTRNRDDERDREERD